MFPELLFHAPFDGSPSPLVAENLTDVPGKIGKAVRIGATLRTKLVYPLARNLRMRKGAVSAWVKREWKLSAAGYGQRVKNPFSPLTLMPPNTENRSVGSMPTQKKKNGRGRW